MSKKGISVNLDVSKWIDVSRPPRNLITNRANIYSFYESVAYSATSSATLA